MIENAKLFSCLYLFFFLLFVINASAFASESITLTDSKEIEDAEALIGSINVMSEKVTKCVEKKLGPPKKCFCLYPKEFENYKTTYKHVIKKYPQWDNKIVSWKQKDSYIGKSLQFSSLKVQASMKCE